MTEHEKRIIDVCIDVIGSLSEHETEGAAGWKTRIQQIKNKQVTDWTFAYYLFLLADCYKRTDLPFSDYLAALAGTYKEPQS